MTEPDAQISEGLAAVAGRITVDDLFGPPEKVGDRTVITAASVDRAGGFGFGSGGDDAGNGGRGGGGGGKAEGRPVAVIEIRPDGITVHPVLDFTRIGVVAVAAFLALRRSRRRA